MQHFTPQQLSAYLQHHQPLLLDVREAWEVALCKLEGVVHMPMREIPARLDELSQQLTHTASANSDVPREIVCICHHGSRSAQVAHFLERNGFDDIINLSGGVDAWAREIDPTMAQY